MAGRRALTLLEERQLLRVLRKSRSRDRTLITTQWLTGFRIGEVLSLTIGDVLRHGRIVPKIGIGPRHLKGHRGRTRWIPVLPELVRALQEHLDALPDHYLEKTGNPLFPSRQSDPGGAVRPLGRSQAHEIIKKIFSLALIEDDGRLGTHTLRKTFARNVYVHGGRDIMLLKRALGHADVGATQRYLEIEEDAVMAAIARCDFTRRPRGRPKAA